MLLQDLKTSRILPCLALLIYPSCILAELLSCPVVCVPSEETDFELRLGMEDNMCPGLEIQRDPEPCKWSEIGANKDLVGNSRE